MDRKVYSATLVLSVAFLLVLSIYVWLTNSSILVDVSDSTEMFLQGILYNKTLNILSGKVYLAASLVIFTMACTVQPLDRHGAMYVLVTCIASIALEVLHYETMLVFNAVALFALPVVLKANLADVFVCYLFNIAVQAMMISIRGVSQDNSNFNNLFLIVIAIENILFMCLMYVSFLEYGGALSWVSMFHRYLQKKLQNWKKWSGIVIRRLIRYKPNVTGLRLKLNDLKTDPRVDTFMIGVAQSCIVLLFIFMTAGVTGKHYEAITFCVSHLVIRPFMPRQFHCKTVETCTILSMFYAFLGITWTYDVSVSLLSGLMVGFVFCWVGYVIADWLDLRIYKAKHESFNLNTCTESELILKCQRKGFSEEDVQNAILCFAKRYSGKQLAEVWQTDVDSARHKKMKLKKRINS